MSGGKTSISFLWKKERRIERKGRKAEDRQRETERERQRQRERERLKKC